MERKILSSVSLIDLFCKEINMYKYFIAVRDCSSSRQDISLKTKIKIIMTETKLRVKGMSEISGISFLVII